MFPFSGQHRPSSIAQRQVWKLSRLLLPGWGFPRQERVIGGVIGHVVVRSVDQHISSRIKMHGDSLQCLIAQTHHVFTVQKHTLNRIVFGLQSGHTRLCRRVLLEDVLPILWICVWSGGAFLRSSSPARSRCLHAFQVISCKIRAGIITPLKGLSLSSAAPAHKHNRRPLQKIHLSDLCSLCPQNSATLAALSTFPHISQPEAEKENDSSRFLARWSGSSLFGSGGT